MQLWRNVLFSLTNVYKVEWFRCLTVTSVPGWSIQNSSFIIVLILALCIVISGSRSLRKKESCHWETSMLHSSQMEQRVVKQVTLILVSCPDMVVLKLLWNKNILSPKSRGTISNKLYPKLPVTLILMFPLLCGFSVSCFLCILLNLE